MTSGDDCGFVYAATGEAYTILARRAARSLRQVMPQTRVDLFTDQPVDDPVFDAIHPVDKVSRRPKMEALLRSRFARTIYLDADTIAIASLDEVFTVLDRFDIALAAEARRCDRRNLVQDPDMPVPLAFPALNSGLIALRKQPQTDAFLRQWHDRVHDGTQLFDQLSLRALLYRSDLRMHVLAPEYNLMWLSSLIRFGEGYAAPRLLHMPRLHQCGPGDPLSPFNLADVMTEEEARLVQSKLERDPTLAGHLDVQCARQPLPQRKSAWRWLRRLRRRRPRKPI